MIDNQPIGEPHFDVTKLPELVESALAAHGDNNFTNGQFAKALRMLGAEKVEDPESRTTTIYNTAGLHPRAKAAIGNILRPYTDQLTQLTALNPHMPTPNIIQLRGTQAPYPRSTNVLLVEITVRDGKPVLTEPTRIQFYREPAPIPPRRP